MCRGNYSERRYGRDKKSRGWSVVFSWKYWRKVRELERESEDRAKEGKDTEKCTISSLKPGLRVKQEASYW